MRLLSNITFLTAVLVSAVGCGNGPIQPPPPPPQLQISCPAAMVREATSPQGADVHFDTPTATGGRAPYTVQCQPGSGRTFAIGETPVSCSATDAEMKQASCGFGVTVRATQTIAKTKFTAFGDSMTEGVVSLAPLIMLGPPDTYPFKLEQMLRERYPSQTIEVINRGLSGERTDRAFQRLTTVLDADKPEVMLLLEGVNAINALPTTTQTAALRAMIVEAQRRGIDVIIATVMPVLPTWRSYQPGVTAPKIQQLNAQIFMLAAQYNLGFPVDLYGLFQARPELIGSDGLHPTAEGQTEIARAFRDEVLRRYGSGSTTSLYTSVRPMR
jgi:lysophospholipase L1-like esterase